MQNTQKFAVSLPRQDYKDMEKARLELGRGRSAVVDEAIRLWLDWLKRKDLIVDYEEGYRRKPEKVKEIKVLEKVQFEALAGEEKW